MTASFLASYGHRLLAQGYPIIPIKPGTKYPGYGGWQHTVADETKLDAWLSNGFAQGGVGVLTRDFPGVDLDVRDAAIIELLVAWCVEHLGETVQRVGLAPKQLLVYRTETPFAKIASSKYVDFLGLEHKVEVLGDGQQFVAFATHPETEEPYEWVSSQSLADVAAEDLPAITEQQARDLVAYFESIIPSDWELVETAPSSKQVDTSIPADDRALAHAKPKSDISTEKLERALTYLDPDMRMHDWVRVGMALHHQYDGDDQGYALWDAWSATGSKYRPSEMRTRWRSFGVDLRTTVPVTVGSLLQMAKQAYRKQQAQPENNAAFRLVPAGDILAKLGPINWRIKGFLERNTTGLIFGDPGSFKSFIALDMAFHVAAGKPWHGHDVEAGPVIYIAGEGHGGLARRFAAWQQHHGIDLADLPFYVSERAAQFYDEDSAKDVVAAVSELVEQTGAPAMIVIDTLARNFGGGDENSSTDVGIFLNHVDGMLRARFGATVMVVHHSGHSNKDRARGASALKAGMDFEYRLEKQEQGLSACLSCTKMKDAREPADIWFEGREIVVGDMADDDMASLVFERGSAPVEEVEKPLKGKQAELYKLIETEAPVTRDTLRNIAFEDGDFTSNDQFRRALHGLRQKDLIVENDDLITTRDAFFEPANL